MGVFKEAMTALRDAQSAWFGEEVTYLTGDGVELQFTAVLGHTFFKQQNEYGSWIRVESKDFIVRKEDLGREPKKGDLIRYADSEYEVLAPNDEPVWRWSDPHQTAYRIHTKHTGGSTDGDGST